MYWVRQVGWTIDGLLFLVAVLAVSTFQIILYFFQKGLSKCAGSSDRKSTKQP